MSLHRLLVEALHDRLVDVRELMGQAIDMVMLVMVMLVMVFLRCNIRHG